MLHNLNIKNLVRKYEILQTYKCRHIQTGTHIRINMYASIIYY